MTAVRALRAEIAGAGYGNAAIAESYVFSDVFAEGATERRVELAAFTQTPPSYRNAALGVIEYVGGDAGQVVADHRALGAPLLFLVSGDNVSVWQVRSSEPARLIARADQTELPALFAQYRNEWNPTAIHRAKSIGAIDRQYQLDFVDAGLLPLVEGQVHAKLDQLIERTLAETTELQRRESGKPLNHRALFRATFRLLAAKVLRDRGHSLASSWNVDDIDSVLESIATYYRLPRLPEERVFTKRLFSAAWERLREGINFRNISSDDLAFVYENTLITPDTRKHFGTHSTPRQVAEYVVGHLELWRTDPERIDIYEPFAGAGVFLVAALRHIRDLLPSEWSDKERHNFLVKRIVGDEVDAFACEVATLSLILADYPNANGWRVSERDLFDDRTLTQRAKGGRIVLCNPPFEDFNQDERERYPEAATLSLNKAAATLTSVLDANPTALGFVLPRAFLDAKQFQGERAYVERQFANVELVALPEGIFKHSQIESCLLIARQARNAAHRRTELRSTLVRQQDREAFLRFGRVSESRSLARAQDEEPGALWIPQFRELWQFLRDNAQLGSMADLHRGLEWRDSQAEAYSKSRRAGYRKGIHRADAVHTLVLDEPIWLDARPENLRRASDVSWSAPKVVLNAIRLSRRAWRLAAAVDRDGLVLSQQLFGCWLKPEATVDLLTLAAILNGPVANAFVADRDPAKGIRVSTMRSIPLPRYFPPELTALVSEYTGLLTSSTFELGRPYDDAAARLLDRIDAIVLRAYDLSPRVEQRLLEHFRGSRRPTVHPWQHWLPSGLGMAVPLHEYVSGRYAQAASNWVVGVFKPLPETEATVVRDYLE